MPELRLPLCAVILAGGRSTRMGRPKAFLSWRGLSLVERLIRQLHPLAEAVVISASEESPFRALGVAVVKDEQPHQGPLGGIVSVLRRSSHELNLVVACDIPIVPQAVISALFQGIRDAELLLVEVGGHPEPLLGLYRRSLVPAIDGLLQRGERRVLSLLDEARGKLLPVADGSWLRNINSPEDYEALQALPPRWLDGA